MANRLKKIDWKIFEPAPVIGLDEVGRGCLAGPVVAGAVCFRDLSVRLKLKDSKLLSEDRRQELAPLICEAHWFGIGVATVEEIEEINILQASFLAMKRALIDISEKMQCKAGHLLVDGHMKIPGVRIPQTPIIKGDDRVAPISAAAIVAKVYRDALMRDLAEKYPHYGFQSNKGYASAYHRKNIKKHGPTEIHRKKFSGVKEFL